eukprot:TRINITY_DN886_c0_g1_i1.p1 TRINITY_DN886_c0_g1~~TRINITY_DN886_c0_g1_i1.p1  ORF type:complete len:382 (-),score=70.55 TRINITY_DN886_c0_g1_i1:137-1282(-)
MKKLHLSFFGGLPQHTSLALIPVLLLLFACFLVAVEGSGFPPPSTNVTLADDAYHLSEFEDKSHESEYMEWWYFNFVDAEMGLAGFFQYGIYDPENKLGLRLPILYAANYYLGSKSAPFISQDIEAGAPFSASSKVANVTLDITNTIRVLDENTYWLQGASPDGFSAWNLTYTRQNSLSVFMDDEDAMSGRYHSRWTNVSWIVYMPQALISGQWTVNGNTFEIKQATGYHDHNFGIWPSWDLLWAWVQYNDDQVVLVGSASTNENAPSGGGIFLLLRSTGEKMFFNLTEVTIDRSNWESVRFVRDYKYPGVSTISNVVSDDGKYQLSLTWTVQTFAFLWKLPVIVFEQVSTYTGSLALADNSGSPINFTGYGFSEWTDKTL